MGALAAVVRAGYQGGADDLGLLVVHGLAGQADHLGLVAADVAGRSVGEVAGSLAGFGLRRTHRELQHLRQPNDLGLLVGVHRRKGHDLGHPGSRTTWVRSPLSATGSRTTWVFSPLSAAGIRMTSVRSAPATTTATVFFVIVLTSDKSDLS